MSALDESVMSMKSSKIKYHFDSSISNSKHRNISSILQQYGTGLDSKEKI